MQKTSAQTHNLPPAVVVGGVAYGDRSQDCAVADRGAWRGAVVGPQCIQVQGVVAPDGHCGGGGFAATKSGGLWSGRDWKRGAPQLAYRREPARSAVGFFIAEVLSTSLEEGAPAPEVFHLARQAADWLETAAEIPWIHVKFMADFVAALGLLPEEPPTNESPFDIATGEYVPRNWPPKRPWTPPRSRA